jgi:hypothetical protein
VDNKLIDKKIESALKQGTDHILELKSGLWLKIEERLEEEKEKETIVVKPKKKLLSRLVIQVSVATVLGVAFFGFTKPGQAAFKRIEQLLLPEKTIVQQLEGNEEETKLTLNEGQGQKAGQSDDLEVSYAIYVDEEMYKVENVGGKDRIVPKLAAENLPQVYMEIEQVADKSPQMLVEEIVQEMKAEGYQLKEVAQVDDPVKGTLVTGSTGNKWNDVVVRYYLVDNQHGGSFVIKQHFFLEAEEGHGARFYYMLKEFRVITKGE